MEMLVDKLSSGHGDLEFPVLSLLSLLFFSLSPSNIFTNVTEMAAGCFCAVYLCTSFVHVCPYIYVCVCWKMKRGWLLSRSEPDLKETVH